jgi:hypothetical protein
VLVGVGSPGSAAFPAYGNARKWIVSSEEVDSAAATVPASRPLVG